ncbi:unnamed protein product [Parnassius mnemosyne]|uniref:Uncharacterized protein n=1 Tax=Parnassius mnemosyne TaxID=213953 RepID=A0AAV1MD12_9NEOP
MQLIAVCILASTCQAIFPFHHHHHHHLAVSHQDVKKNDGLQHPVIIPHAPVHHVSFHHESIHHIPYSHYVPIHNEAHHDHFAFPEYNFAYAVHDHHTGDVKSQHEFRHGDLVKGGYELFEHDGRYRKVEYKDDDHTGFNAVVHHSSPHHHVHVLQHHF